MPTLSRLLPAPVPAMQPQGRVGGVTDLLLRQQRCSRQPPYQAALLSSSSKSGAFTGELMAACSNC